MTTEQKLLQHGYTKSVCRTYKAIMSTDTLYQKRVRDDEGTKYFINAWYYPPLQLPGRDTIKATVKFESQMECEGNTVDVSPIGVDVENAERLFEKLWWDMGGCHYE